MTSPMSRSVAPVFEHASVPPPRCRCCGHPMELDLLRLWVCPLRDCDANAELRALRPDRTTGR
jgi:hypothetical protein